MEKKPSERLVWHTCILLLTTARMTHTYPPPQMDKKPSERLVLQLCARALGVPPSK